MNRIHPSLSLLSSSPAYQIDDPHRFRNLQPPPMLIDNFLTKGTVMGITAMPGVGKSWLAMEAMRAVATGTKFLGRFQARQEGVLFVGSDSSLYDYARQWRRLTASEYASHHYAGDEEDGVRPNEPYDAVRWLIQSPFLFEDARELCSVINTHRAFKWGELVPIYNQSYDTDPESPTYGQVLRDVVGHDYRRGFGLIVFDTLSRLTRAQQNDNTEMERVFTHIRLIAEQTGASVLLIHHNSKPSEYNDGTDWRGAMAQIGALDSWVNISKKKDEKDIVSVQFKKFRGITPDNFRYKMNVGDDDKASLEYLDSNESHFGDSEDGAIPVAIRRVLASSPTGMTVTGVADKLYDEFKDIFPDEAKFKKAIRNRLYEKGSPLFKYVDRNDAVRPAIFTLKKEAAK